MWAKSVLLSNWISRRVTRGGRGGGLPRPFSKIRKKCPSFRKKCRNCVHLRLNVLIWNVVLRVSRRKKIHIFSLRAFVSCVVDVYRRGLIPRKLPCPEKFLVTRLISLARMKSQDLKPWITLTYRYEIQMQSLKEFR